ncbi:unnamed protein product [Mytilus coruscus]|uniref:Reverse transcriptase zinc-binding domain-containing protein n=1 Tax=Mytilus coruscus TaxID=42192 RepID=A0A6J8ESA1_MYTCO|nr:unnamed protein product [Mytilus coruscus]
MSQLKVLPRVYQEMIQAYYSLKSEVEFDIEIQHIYENPIFCNPVISNNGRALLYSEFINSGIVQIKDICYEFIPGFLSKDSIVELVQEKHPELKSRIIAEAYAKILNAIPKLWKKDLNQINPVNVDRIPSLTVGTKMIEFSKVTTKIFYKLLLQKISESPTSEHFWTQHYPSMCFKSLYLVVNQCHLPPECVSLNYRVVTNTIFTLSKLCRMGKHDNSTCLSCRAAPEDMFHLWTNCPSLVNFKSYVIDILHNVLLKDTLNPILDYTQLILLGYLKNTKEINTYFVNFLLSVARISIYKSRQIKVFDDKDIDIKRLFIFTMKKYVLYAFTYYITNNRLPLFEKYYVNKNPLMRYDQKSFQLLI